MLDKQDLQETSMKSSCCASMQQKPKDIVATVPPALRAFKANGARIPNLEKIYQLPDEQRGIALQKLLRKILLHFIARHDVSNERMKLALGFDRPMLAQWMKDAKAKTQAQQA
jgi:hypothetical protein